MKRIYICGSHSTGKTTLVTELRNQLGSQFSVCLEVARQIILSENYSIQDMDSKAYLANIFQNKVFERHLEAHKLMVEAGLANNDSGIIFDRGIDFLAYAVKYSSLAHIQYMAEQTQEYIDGLKDSKAYVFLILPQESLLSNDGVRHEPNMKSAIEITAMIQCLLEIHNIPYIPIHEKTVTERIKLIRSVIKE